MLVIKTNILDWTRSNETATTEIYTNHLFAFIASMNPQKIFYWCFFDQKIYSEVVSTFSVWSPLNPATLTCVTWNKKENIKWKFTSDIADTILIISEIALTITQISKVLHWGLWISNHVEESLYNQTNADIETPGYSY